MKPILSDADLFEITGKLQHAARARVLEGWHVPYERRPDGSLVVGRVAFDEAMARRKSGKKVVNDDGFNWSKA